MLRIGQGAVERVPGDEEGDGLHTLTAAAEIGVQLCAAADEEHQLVLMFSGSDPSPLPGAAGGAGGSTVGERTPKSHARRRFFARPF